MAQVRFPLYCHLFQTWRCYSGCVYCHLLHLLFFNYAPLPASLPFPFSRWAKARAYVSAEIHRHPAVETDGQADRQSRFSRCVGRVFSYPFLCCSLSLLHDHGESTLCITSFAFSSWLSICSSGGPSVWPCCADHTLTISKTTADPFFTLNTILFSKIADSSSLWSFNKLLISF